MRVLIAVSVLFFSFFSNSVTAQMVPDAPSRVVQPDQSAKYEILRGAINDTGIAYSKMRRSDAWNDTASGLVSAGIGGYLLFVATQNSDLFLSAISVTAIGLGVRSLVSGVFNFTYPYSQERITDKLLEDRDLLLSSGLMFLEQEALSAKRRRIVGGTMSILNAGTYGLMYFPLSQYAGSDTTLLAVVIGIGAGLELIGGIITLVGKSGPERVYERTKAQLDFQGGDDRDRRLTLDWNPTFQRTEDGSWGGVTFGGTF